MRPPDKDTRQKMLTHVGSRPITWFFFLPSFHFAEDSLMESSLYLFPLSFFSFYSWKGENRPRTERLGPVSLCGRLPSFTEFYQVFFLFFFTWYEAVGRNGDLGRCRLLVAAVFCGRVLFGGSLRRPFCSAGPSTRRPWLAGGQPIGAGSRLIANETTHYSKERADNERAADFLRDISRFAERTRTHTDRAAVADWSTRGWGEPISSRDRCVWQLGEIDSRLMRCLIESITAHYRYESPQKSRNSKTKLMKKSFQIEIPGQNFFAFCLL